MDKVALMNSPVHSDTPMVLKEIEPGLSAYECPRSGGVWIPLHSYLDWKERQPVPANAPPAEGRPVLVDDSRQRALICPESGRLLVRYRVGHGLSFHVDQSPATGGMWLDKGEWAALKSKGLHSQLNLIFTATYQRQIRSAEYARKLEEVFQARIGEKDFQTTSDFRDWLANHPRRADILCYLNQLEEKPSNEQ